MIDGLSAIDMDRAVSQAGFDFRQFILDINGYTGVKVMKRGHGDIPKKIAGRKFVFLGQLDQIEYSGCNQLRGA